MSFILNEIIFHIGPKVLKNK